VDQRSPPLPVHAYQFDVLYDPQMLQLEATPVNLSNTLSGGLTAVTSLAFSGLMLNEANPAADGKNGKVVVRR
jgi:hypothetical protein